MRALPLLALLLLAPFATATTLRDLEEPQRSDGLKPIAVRFTALEEEIGPPYVIIFRVPLGTVGYLELTDAQGRAAWATNYTNGMRDFFASNGKSLMTPGNYTLTASKGEVIVTQRILISDKVDPVPRRDVTFDRPTHSWVVLSKDNAWHVNVSGEATATWHPLPGASETKPAPAGFVASKGLPFVLTVRGEVDDAYAIETAIASDPLLAKTPLPVPAILLAIAVASLVAPRMRR